MLLFTVCFVLIVLNLPKILTMMKLVIYGVAQTLALMLMYGLLPALFMLSVMLKTKGTM